MRQFVGLVLSRVQKSDGCWEWSGARTKAGYGLVKVGGRKGKNLYTHRTVAAALIGEIPPGYYVCHRCDNPRCCRPDHLFIGTPADNNWDKSRKGRAVGPGLRGELVPSAKLKAKDVVAIREQLRAGRKGKDIAASFGVSPTTISSIKLGKRWKQ